MQLSNQNGKVIADAVRIEKRADIAPGAPALAVVSGAPIGSGDSANLGTTFAGEAINKTFTVTNAGTGDLTLGTIACPTGFNVLPGFSATTLSPGQSATFTLQLSAAAAGTYSGSVSFSTNDPNNSTFVLALSGTVTAQGFLDDTSASFSGGSWQGRAGSIFTMPIIRSVPEYPTIIGRLFPQERRVGRLAAWNQDCIKSQPTGSGVSVIHRMHRIRCSTAVRISPRLQPTSKSHQAISRMLG